MIALLSTPYMKYLQIYIILQQKIQNRTSHFFSVIWIFFMGIKFHVFNFCKDFYLRV